MTLKEIAEYIGGEVVGDGEVVIRGLSGIKEAGEGEITFVANAKYVKLIKTTSASAVIVSKEIDLRGKPLIKVDNPDIGFAKAAVLFFPDDQIRPNGIHSTAVIAEDVVLGSEVGIGACAVIEKGAVIGDRTVIYPGVYIGAGSSVGTDSLIHANVSIRDRVIIGKSVIIHSGTVIGSDGFGFAESDGARIKIPQIGIVEIGDDVEIGANVTIDRARFGKTVVGKGTKIDNLVQIAHNVEIGENSILVSQCGISGSTKLGKEVILAGQAGLVGHIELGDRVIVTAQSGVTKDIPAGTCVFGSPAHPIEKARRIQGYVQRLPKLVKRVEELEKLAAERNAGG